MEKYIRSLQDYQSDLHKKNKTVAIIVRRMKRRRARIKRIGSKKKYVFKILRLAVFQVRDLTLIKSIFSQPIMPVGINRIKIPNSNTHSK